MTYIPKFRIWHKIDKKMFKVEELDFGPNGAEEVGFLDIISKYPKPQIYRYSSINECELMQSTGLFSKSGVEIFEGDVLTYDYVGGIDTYVIERNREDNQLCSTSLYIGDFYSDNLNKFILLTSIIRGNIYENPKLLRGNND